MATVAPGPRPVLQPAMSVERPVGPPWGLRGTYRQAEALLREVLPRLPRALTHGRLVFAGCGAAGLCVEPEPGWSYTAVHAHAQPEVAVCIAGTACMWLGDRWLRLEPFDVCVIGAGQAHNESWLREDAPYALLWLRSDGGTAALWVGRYRPTATPRFSVESQFRVRHVDDGLLARVQAELLARRPGFREAAADYLRAFLQSVARGQVDRRYALPGSIRAACDFVIAHRGQPVRPADVARAVGLSPPRLAVVFKRYTGLTLGGYLRELRMRDALYLLATQRARVAEVAHACGYRDPLYFSRVFSRWAGCAPSAVRARGADGADPRLLSRLDDWWGPALRGGANLPGRPG